MANILFFLWIGMAVGVLLLLGYAAIQHFRDNYRPPETPEEIFSTLSPVDLDNLKEILNSLNAGATTSIRREQIQAAMRALGCMGKNAAALQRLGYAHIHSRNQLISSLAQEMIDAGVNVRLHVFGSIMTLRLRSQMEHWGLSKLAFRPASLQELLDSRLRPSYEELKQKAGNLVALKHSGSSELLAQSL